MLNQIKLIEACTSGYERGYINFDKCAAISNISTYIIPLLVKFHLYACRWVGKMVTIHVDATSIKSSTSSAPKVSKRQIKGWSIQWSAQTDIKQLINGSRKPKGKDCFNHVHHLHQMQEPISNHLHDMSVIKGKDIRHHDLVSMSQPSVNVHQSNGRGKKINYDCLICNNPRSPLDRSQTNDDSSLVMISWRCF